jgi:hypothetical protein
MIKSRRIRKAGHVARMVERRGVCTIWWGKMSERKHLQDTRIEDMIIFKWFFGKWEWVMDWNNLAQNRDRWWALVTVAMNFREP